MMKTVLVYASSHGTTRKAVSRAVPQLCVAPEVFNVKDIASARRLLDFNVLLFFCPTYGDEELQEDMEAFLLRLDLDLTGKRFAICELGSYYGYEDFSFGALRILRRKLLSLGAAELCAPLSLDSYPRVPWPQLSRWIDCLNTKLEGSGPSNAVLYPSPDLTALSRNPRAREPDGRRAPAQSLRAGVFRGPARIDTAGLAEPDLCREDALILDRLRERIGVPFRFATEGGRCVDLDLTDPCNLYRGVIRHHSAAEKDAILRLISRLTGLRSLNLRWNKLGRLPESIADLTLLEQLNLGSNALGLVPPALKKLSALRYLHLGNNGLSELPAFAGEFDRLEYHALHKNLRLRSVDALAGLKKLRTLNLYYLNLRRLPQFICGLIELRSLALWNMATFPDELACLTQLEQFTACGAPGLRVLPKAMTQLKNLRMVRLYQNSLTELPEEIGALQQLEQISLYQNRLSRLPDSVGSLQRLRKLNLGWNCFAALPGWLRESASIEWLGVFGNPLDFARGLPVPPRATVVRDWPFSTLHEPSSEAVL